MIVAEKKPIEEIIEVIKDYRKILLLGCNECVTVCEAGGKKEVGVLASALRMYFLNQGDEKDIDEITLERQCDHEYLEEIQDDIESVEGMVERVFAQAFMKLDTGAFGIALGLASGLILFVVTLAAYFGGETGLAGRLWLIRQYFPKKTSFINICRDQTKFVEKRLNQRPRKALGFITPLECFWNSKVAFGT